MLHQKVPDSYASRPAIAANKSFSGLIIDDELDALSDGKESVRPESSEEGGEATPTSRRCPPSSIK